MSKMDEKEATKPIAICRPTVMSRSSIAFELALAGGALKYFGGIIKGASP
jgi:hypothetical protein